jgi:hypothetical protein
MCTRRFLRFRVGNYSHPADAMLCHLGGTEEKTRRVRGMRADQRLCHLRGAEIAYPKPNSRPSPRVITTNAFPLLLRGAEIHK